MNGAGLSPKGDLRTGGQGADLLDLPFGRRTATSWTAGALARIIHERHWITSELGAGFISETLPPIDCPREPRVVFAARRTYVRGTHHSLLVPGNVRTKSRIVAEADTERKVNAPQAEADEAGARPTVT